MITVNISSSSSSIVSNITIEKKREKKYTKGISFWRGCKNMKILKKGDLDRCRKEIWEGFCASRTSIHTYIYFSFHLIHFFSTHQFIVNDKASAAPGKKISFFIVCDDEGRASAGIGNNNNRRMKKEMMIIGMRRKFNVGVQSINLHDKKISFLFFLILLLLLPLYRLNGGEFLKSGWIFFSFVLFLLLMTLIA